MPKKYQIFVSSTFQDLIDERQDALKCILDLGHIPAGMEGFPAIDVEQFKYIKKVIDECDYYILIVGARYGSIDDSGISYTQKEYEYAVATGKAVLAFVHQDSSLLPPEKIENDPTAIKKLQAFKSQIMSGRLVHQWKDRDGLKYGVMKSLVAAFEEHPTDGWIRASAAASEDILSQINTLRIENDNLEAEIARLKKSLTPKIKNIAPLDSPYKVNFTYYENRADRPGYATMTWRQIFMGVGPDLMRAHNPTQISKSLRKYMKDMKFTNRSVSILDSAENQIKIQLTALGLISNFEGKVLNGGMAEWVKITDYGKRVLMETMVIRDDAGMAGPDV